MSHRHPEDQADTIRVKFDDALRHHRSGRLTGAHRLYTEILAEDPRHTDAMHLLGVLFHQVGRSEVAVDLIGKAIDAAGTIPVYHANYGSSLEALGRLDEALAAYARSLELDPTQSDAHCNRGNALQRLGREDEALQAFRRSIALKPDYAEAHYNRGNLLKSLNRLDEALVAYGLALRVKPTLAEAHSNRALLLHALKCADHALAASQTAIDLRPDLAEAYINRGIALQALGDSGKALYAYDFALRIRPGSTEALHNRGNALADLGRPDQALEAYDTVLSFDPTHVDAQLGRGDALRKLDRLTEALAAYDCALRFKSDRAETHANRANLLMSLGRFQESEAACRAALILKPSQADILSNLILNLQYRSDIDEDALQHAARDYAEQFEGRHVAPPFSNTSVSSRRLKVGYVSADFRRHSVSFFLEPVLRHRDPATLEIYCYDNGVKADEVTVRLRAAADHWRPIAGLSDEAAADLIRADGIDILVDLSGHTAGNRLPMFARRAAPVQATWIGYPNTTGLTSMDYRLIDAITDPPEEGNSGASEILHRLPDGFLCYEPPKDAPEPRPRPGERPLSFGSFNNPSKLSEATLDLWAKLLQRVPQARLVLKGRSFRDPAACRHLLDRFETRGVARGRLVLLPAMPAIADHLASYGEIDIGLDPVPYNGTTTTCEALWMGVPVVTLRGRRHAGRVGASLLARVGLDDLVADDAEDYVRIAAALAEDETRRVRLRASLRERMAASPLCDGPHFTRQLEAAYLTMWNEWRDGRLENRSFRERIVETADGTQISLPESLRSMTTYVLVEQGKWFEKEVDFIQRWLRPGMVAIDIGANLGVYSLPMARQVAPNGRVYAYEPSSGTRRFLERSRDLNEAAHLTIIDAALSDGSRQGWLSQGSSSETNRLGADDRGESVRITSLDEEDETRGWPSPDFVKIDAEGEEIPILAGGRSFFERHSPLVMFEVKSDRAADHLSQTLRSGFQNLGYGLYRCLTGFPILVPIDDGWKPDPYELNLFAAKPDRAYSLAQEGMLVEALQLWAPDEPAWRRLDACWKALPYTAAFGDLFSALPADPDYSACLAAFATWRSPEPSWVERCSALDYAARHIAQLAEEPAVSPARRITFARIAWEAGWREACVKALRSFIEEMKQGSIRLDEPFWPASSRFDSLPAGAALGDWLLASAVELRERAASFSSYFAAPSPDLAWLCDTPFANDEMRRRLRLSSSTS